VIGGYVGNKLDESVHEILNCCAICKDGFSSNGGSAVAKTESVAASRGGSDGSASFDVVFAHEFLNELLKGLVRRFVGLGSRSVQWHDRQKLLLQDRELRPRVWQPFSASLFVWAAA
jgi:hypothetical protein